MIRDLVTNDNSASTFRAMFTSAPKFTASSSFVKITRSGLIAAKRSTA